MYSGRRMRQRMALRRVALQSPHGACMVGEVYRNQLPARLLLRIYTRTGRLLADFAGLPLLHWQDVSRTAAHTPATALPRRAGTGSTSSGRTIW
ncbi:hypothetical protein DLM_3521 [Aquitalea magnusonii]|uniref:Uncharacterized protein n=1 Tax=Aquitalea magnusonii TaxID=332411 RepID=A0A3G9GQ40_9NEIS|nr:hypothetical protein DLM_3521 [Aquitalea magnusonii]